MTTFENYVARDSAERAERLRQEVELKAAKLAALEDGTWQWIEWQDVHRRQITAGDLAKQFDISVQAANNRLKRLMGVGLLSRTKSVGSGGPFAYSTVLWLEGAAMERAMDILRRRRGGIQQLGLHDHLWAALAGYDAQYGGGRGLAEQHPELPSGCRERIESLVQAARDVVEWSHPHGSWS